jgi:hypothetical protein
MNLMDSSTTIVYNLALIRRMLVEWLQHRFPSHLLEMPQAIERVDVPEQVATNSCGVHVIHNLMSVAQGEELSQEISELWVNQQRDRFLRLLVQSGVSRLGPEVQRRVELEMANIDEASDGTAGESEKKRRRLE